MMPLSGHRLSPAPLRNGGRPLRGMAIEVALGTTHQAASSLSIPFSFSCIISLFVPYITVTGEDDRVASSLFDMIGLRAEHDKYLKRRIE